MKLIITLCFFLALYEAIPLNEKIEHVIVVMMENRAFDHMLGYLKTELPEIEGLDGTQFNFVDPFDESSEKVFVNSKSGYVTSNFGHSFEDTGFEIFGKQNHSGLPVEMNGFVACAKAKHIKDYVHVMDCFNPKSLPTLNTLAKEFGVCDKWYASVPGPTEVNRFYMHTGTSAGLANNDMVNEAVGMPQRSIFQNLQDNGKTWKIYMEEVSTTLFLSQMRQLKYLQNYRYMPQFHEDARSGNLPNYAFIEPRYFEVLGYPANDQHPDHNAAYGEIFINSIYESVRASPQWNKTALIITYDEHGGLYDHFKTPDVGIPNPDGINSKNPPFDFQRIGIRIPTVIVSPWIPKSTVEHEPTKPTSQSQYDHTSTISFVKRLFNLPEFLTKRDAWSGEFDHIFSLDEPRTDCPTSVPTPPLPKNYKSAHEQPLNDLHWYFIEGLAAINKTPKLSFSSLKTEQQGAAFIQEQVQILLNHE